MKKSHCGLSHVFLERVITLLRIALMLGLVWLLLDKGKELPKKAACGPRDAFSIGGDRFGVFASQNRQRPNPFQRDAR